MGCACSNAPGKDTAKYPARRRPRRRGHNHQTTVAISSNGNLIAISGPSMDAGDPSDETPDLDQMIEHYEQSEEAFDERASRHRSKVHQAPKTMAVGPSNGASTSSRLSSDSSGSDGSDQVTVLGSSSRQPQESKKLFFPTTTLAPIPTLKPVRITTSKTTANQRGAAILSGGRSSSGGSSGRTSRSSLGRSLESQDLEDIDHLNSSHNPLSSSFADLAAEFDDFDLRFDGKQTQSQKVRTV